MLEHSRSDPAAHAPRARGSRSRREIPLSELVVLGLVGERPRHGYDIEQEVTARRLRAWTPLGRSLLYHVLTRCSARGLLTTEEVAGKRGAAARVCTLTAAGREHLRRALVDALANDVLDIPRAQVALMFSGLLGREATVAALRERADRVTQALARARRSRAAPPDRSLQPAGLVVRDLIHRRQEQLLDAEARWCAEAIAALEALEP